MIRGTTPTHYFNIAFDTSEIKALEITYAQDDKIIVKKCKDDCELTGKTIAVTLTQDDTFKFNCENRVQVQLRALTVSGVVLGSYPKPIPVEKCFSEEVLT